MSKVLIILLLLCVPAVAQDSQVSASFVYRDQTRLGYKPHNVGAKLELDYKLTETLTAVAYGTALYSPKVDSGTGKSGFVSAGVRWSPTRVRFGRFEPFGEFDAILGALKTDPYRKTVFHFRNGLGTTVGLGEYGSLLVEVSRLYQDILPDAAKLLKEEDAAALHTTFNQLSAWEFELQHWSPTYGDSKLGIKTGLRHSRSKFLGNPNGDLRRGWLLQFEVGVYRKL